MGKLTLLVLNVLDSIMLFANKIKNLIASIERVSLVDDFSINEAGWLSGRILVDVEGEDPGLIWDVEIYSTYPFKVMGYEPIKFRNKSLLAYPHIMQDGILCMHPAEYENADCQFIHDVEQLKEWVDKYYIKKEEDDHYEHIVVSNYPIRDQFYTFCFAETQKDFMDGDYGNIQYTRLLNGYKQEKMVNNFIIQNFVSSKQIKKNNNLCKISQTYQKLPSYYGIYCILKDIPSIHNKFIIEDYYSIKDFFSQEQKDYIHTFVQLNERKAEYFPLLCGYRIPEGEIYWQAMMLFMNDLPIKPFYVGAGKYRIWHTDFKYGLIQWAQTENISYKYFFGRGSMPEKLIDKKVLIMGVGAIGSMVAETLTRCGAKYISLFDIDIKEPGNVCRSTYSFFTGITAKALELSERLTQISPHVECTILKSEVDLLLKLYATECEGKRAITDFLDEYDIVFDCTTDNQLMRLIDGSETKAQRINLSITNYAQDLICAISPNVVDTVQLVYSLLNRNTEMDMYNPTGCWSPTFKASYNDISGKVHFAMKHIFKMLSNEEPSSSFYITEDELNLKIHRL